MGKQYRKVKLLRTKRRHKKTGNSRGDTVKRSQRSKKVFSLSLRYKEELFEMKRVYIDIIAEITPEGDIFPRQLHLEDGSVFAVDRRLERPRPCFNADGSTSLRFRCLVENRQVLFFYDEDTMRWWVEGEN